MEAASSLSSFFGTPKDYIGF
jgi:hypothetical protein